MDSSQTVREERKAPVNFAKRVCNSLSTAVGALRETPLAPGPSPLVAKCVTKDAAERVKEPCECDGDAALPNAATVPGPRTTLHAKGRAAVKELAVMPGAAFTSYVASEKDRPFLKRNNERAAGGEVG